VVDIRTACGLLSNWDGRYNLDSIGAIVFRELLSGVDGKGLFGGTSYFAEPFDPLDPVQTPSGLSDEGKIYLLGRLADAVLRLQSAAIPLDAPLGDYQYTLQGSERFAIHGGRTLTDGVFNVVVYALDPFHRNNSSLQEQIPRPPLVNEPTRLFETGYLINFGGSFIMTVEFTDDGPVADAILTYAQSDDPDSPHFADQMSLYSSSPGSLGPWRNSARKTWRLRIAQQGVLFSVRGVPFLTID
jgi:acyl-homoserine-lactone acylase